MKFRLMEASLLFVLFAAFPVSATEPSKEAWTVAAPAPNQRGEVAAAMVDGKIYIIGGFTPFGVTGRVDVYDPATNTWGERSPMPAELHHVGVGVVDGKLYAIGGFDGLMFWTPSKAVWEYDPKKDRWHSKQEMPTARGALGVAVWEGKVYAIGGLTETPFGRENVDANDVYDPAADRWESKAPLPLGRDHLAVVALDGKIHAIGGRKPGASISNLNEVFVVN